MQGRLNYWIGVAHTDNIKTLVQLVLIYSKRLILVFIKLSINYITFFTINVYRTYKQ